MILAVAAIAVALPSCGGEKKDAEDAELTLADETKGQLDDMYDACIKFVNSESAENGAKVLAMFKAYKDITIDIMNESKEKYADRKAAEREWAEANTEKAVLINNMSLFVGNCLYIGEK